MLIPLTEEEMLVLVMNANSEDHVSVAFGTGGCALDTDYPDREFSVKKLAELRGVTVQDLLASIEDSREVRRS